MTPLTGAQLLSLWEAGESWPAYTRAVLLLAAARPDDSPSAVAEFSLGYRDGQLLRLRRLLFGGRLSGVADCEQCGQPLEFDFTPQLPSPAGPPPAIHTVEVDGWQVRFRLPNSNDLAALAAAGSAEAGRRLLLEACLLELSGPDGAAAPDEVAPELLQQIESHMGELDPQAELAVVLTCPACAAATTSFLEVIDFFWQEIDQWARHTLHEIHMLAAAYGWGESEILALSPRRRQQYLGFIYG